MHEGEPDDFVPTTTLARHRAEGVLDTDPVRDPRARGGESGWLVCEPCTARLNARKARHGA